MKLLIFLALATVAFAKDKEVKVLQDTREDPVGAVYNFNVELDNGIRFRESGSEGPDGQSVVEGVYEFLSPEGENIKVNYIADQNGFQPESDALPEAPPLPPHAEELIRQAEELRAKGIKWDEKGFQI